MQQGVQQGVQQGTHSKEVIGVMEGKSVDVEGGAAGTSRSVQVFVGAHQTHCKQAQLVSALPYPCSGYPVSAIWKHFIGTVCYWLAKHRSPVEPVFCAVVLGGTVWRHARGGGAVQALEEILVTRTGGGRGTHTTEEHEQPQQRRHHAVRPRCRCICVTLEVM